MPPPITLPRVVRSGRHTVEPLGPAQGDSEAGHHLVEDQQGAVLVADSTQAFEKARLRRDAVHIAGHRLDDDAGDLAADGGKGLLHLFQVVVIQGDGQLGQGRGDSGGTGLAQGEGAGSGLHQQGV